MAYYSNGVSPKAANERLCLLNDNRLDARCRFSVTLGTKPSRPDAGSIDCINLIQRQSVHLFWGCSTVLDGILHDRRYVVCKWP